ncbi:hypothetical protein [Trabulsiella odontotermitis]|uniref:hypothetical protein n=1 Tax=Trabulsiella odontotermitis TaxID=379893 RepID=UPI00092D1E4A|nr:hypothetical protein [Trabulsiella odontotermitis]
MNVKKYNAAFMAISTVITIISGVYFFYHDIVQGKISEKFETCSSKMVIIDGEARLNLSLTFMLEDKSNKGIVNVEGTSFINNKIESIIDRNVEFSYIKTENGYNFTSTKIVPLKGETISPEMAMLKLPLIYASKGGELNYTLLFFPGKGVLFTLGKIPRFFCETIS